MSSSPALAPPTQRRLPEDASFWVISSGQGCNPDGPDQNGDICSKAMSVPNELRTDRDGERTHVYALTKYVFARDCQTASIVERRMAAGSNKVQSSGTTSGFMCKEINFADGTVDENGTAVPTRNSVLRPSRPPAPLWQ